MAQTIIEFLANNQLIAYPVLLGIMSTLTFMTYAWDKHQAKKRRWRISESRLHTLAFLGGWPGAMLGRRYFRHKTQKPEFTFMIWAALLLHFVFVGAYIYFNISK